MTQLADQSEAIVAFANAALAYCTLVDTGEGSKQSLQRALAQLQICALDLPETFDEGAPELDSVPVPSRLAEIISTLQVDLYWEVFEPLVAQPENPTCGSLADDLGDIYRDLKRGLALFQLGHHSGAAWEWRFGFLNHWGRHLLGAQRALFLAPAAPEGV